MVGHILYLTIKLLNGLIFKIIFFFHQPTLLHGMVYIAVEQLFLNQYLLWSRLFYQLIAHHAIGMWILDFIWIRSLSEQCEKCVFRFLLIFLFAFLQLKIKNAFKFISSVKSKRIGDFTFNQRTRNWFNEFLPN